MPAHKTLQFALRFLIAKCNRNIAFCQSPIFPRNDPRANAELLPDGKEKPQRHRGDNGRPRTIKEINDKIEHRGTAGIAVWRGRVDLPAACFNQYNVRC